jgi:RNA:NAD 2'-phosphotransferase (TPT1/KptA family)
MGGYLIRSSTGVKNRRPRQEQGHGITAKVAKNAKTEPESCHQGANRSLGEVRSQKLEARMQKCGVEELETRAARGVSAKERLTASASGL